MKIIPVVFLVFLQVLSKDVQSQKNEISLSESIYKWFVDLTRNSDSFFEHERKSQVYRELGYIEQDLKDYLVVRKTLVDSIDRFDEVSSAPYRDTLRIALRNLLDRVRGLQKNLTKSVGRSTDSLIDQLELVFKDRQGPFLSQVETYMTGWGHEAFDKKSVLFVANDVQRDLIRSLNKVKALRAELDE